MRLTVQNHRVHGAAYVGACIVRGHGGPQDSDRLYTPEKITAELGGLVIRRAEQVLRPVPTPEGERTAIDTLVRAERRAQQAPRSPG